jgi:hypothetical protein
MVNGGITPYSCLTISLLKKTREMIDRYCEPKQIDGFAYHPTDYTGCDHDWQEVEMHPMATPTIICTKCRAIHFIREAKQNV